MTLAVLMVAVSLGLATAMAGAWVLQRALGNAGWADVVWTFATGAAGVAYALTPASGWSPGLRAWLVAALIAGWSVRLGLHLMRRTVVADREDARYAAFRRDWGLAFEWRLLGFLEIQAFASALLTLTMLAAARNPAPFPSWSDVAGVALLVLAVIGEGVADAQLAGFKAHDLRGGGVCDVGLWGWSRHPNYFFEWLGWLGYAVIAIGPVGAWPLGWIALIGPAFMYVLLRYVSGVPPTEAAMAKSRGPSFAAYQARVSPFFPLPPRTVHAREPAT
jgi:steroid 5-alpha reductase family enzyme